MLINIHHLYKSLIIYFIVIEKGDLNELKKDTVPSSINALENKSRSATMLSIMEKQIIQKIREKKQSNQKNALKKLIWVSIVCVIFFAAELVGGIISKSDFLLSDALHMLTDFYGFAVSMFSIYISAKPPTKLFTFGYYRCEVLGALVSVISIWGISAWILMEAIEKVISGKYEINGDLMLIIAIIGLIANIAMGHILHSSGGHVSKFY
jgi:Co/Zn/Cd efflux system component